MPFARYNFKPYLSHGDHSAERPSLSNKGDRKGLQHTTGFWGIASRVEYSEVHTVGRWMLKAAAHVLWSSRRDQHSSSESVVSETLEISESVACVYTLFFACLQCAWRTGAGVELVTFLFSCGAIRSETLTNLRSI